MLENDTLANFFEPVGALQEDASPVGSQSLHLLFEEHFVLPQVFLCPFRPPRAELTLRACPD